MSLSKEQPIEIREVWGDNLEAEFLMIREIIDKFPLVAMDTEFPGIVCRPVGNFGDSDRSEFLYATLKANVDMMKLIQLGLTLSDEAGNHPGCVWQFNFREFHPASDIHAVDSIELLSTCGIDFYQNAVRGVDAARFGELLMSSGIVLNDEIRWITFHSSYDFGYLVKLLTGKNLPDTQDQFLEHLNMYFPVIYDIKHLLTFCNGLHGGLNTVAKILGVERVGVSHQAGSDSLLTLSTFLKMREVYSGVAERNAGVLYGFRPYRGGIPIEEKL